MKWLLSQVTSIMVFALICVQISWASTEVFYEGWPYVVKKNDDGICRLDIFPKVRPVVVLGLFSERYRHEIHTSKIIGKIPDGESLMLTFYKKTGEPTQMMIPFVPERAGESRYFFKRYLSSSPNQLLLTKVQNAYQMGIGLRTERGWWHFLMPLTGSAKAIEMLEGCQNLGVNP